MSAPGITTFRLGEAREPGAGVFRICVTRYAQRGVAREERRAVGQFDAWLPQLAPSAELLRAYQGSDQSAAAWQRFARGYRREMAAPSPRHLIATLAELSRHQPLSVGCFCADASRCHRTLLCQLLSTAGGERVL